MKGDIIHGHSLRIRLVSWAGSCSLVADSRQGQRQGAEPLMHAWQPAKARRKASAHAHPGYQGCHCSRDTNGRRSFCLFHCGCMPQNVSSSWS